jgi:hypothetical protein
MVLRMDLWFFFMMDVIRKIDGRRAVSSCAFKGNRYDKA